MAVSARSVEHLKEAFLHQLQFPEVASLFRTYVEELQSKNPVPATNHKPSMVKVLRAGVLFGGLLAATSRQDLFKLAEAGGEDAQIALRELVGTCAVYPGSFDPFTLGHGDVVRRAVKLFDRVVVAIGVNPAKRALFTVEEKIKLIKEDLKDLGDKVDVVSFEGSLVALAKQLDCNVVLRGVRSVTDYEQELQLALVNLALSKGGVETLFIPAKEGASYVSSSVVKTVVQLGEDASGMVSPPVLAALQAKIKEGKL